MILWIKKVLGLVKVRNNGTNRPIKELDTPKNKEETAMKYLIVGLGNMEHQYDDTRHNVGFEVADALVHQADSTYKIVKLGLQATFKHKGRNVIVHKPNTYMNLSGKAVKYWMEKHKIKRENLLILVDDIHTDFDQIRLRSKGSNAGHNGLKDIELKLGGTNYPRLKIGIGGDFRKGRQVDYVLGKWSKNEVKGLPEIMDSSILAIKDFVSIGISRAMTIHNKKKN